MPVARCSYGTESGDEADVLALPRSNLQILEASVSQPWFAPFESPGEYAFWDQQRRAQAVQEAQQAAWWASLTDEERGEHQRRHAEDFERHRRAAELAAAAKAAEEHRRKAEEDRRHAEKVAAVAAIHPTPGQTATRRRMAELRPLASQRLRQVPDLTLSALIVFSLGGTALAGAVFGSSRGNLPFILGFTVYPVVWLLRLVAASSQRSQVARARTQLAELSRQIDCGETSCTRCGIPS